MKKLYFFIAIITIFFFFSCKHQPEVTPAPIVEKPQEEVKDPVQNKDTVTTDTTVTFVNSSKFDVKVYSDPARTNLLCSIESQKSKTIDAEANSSGTSYYITYYVNVGIQIPWSNTDSYVIAAPQAHKNVNKAILNPESMETNDCFIVLENNSKSSIIFKRGSSELGPETNKSKTILSSEEKGVYKIDRGSFGNFPTFKIITVNNQEITFPSNFRNFEKGQIITLDISDTKDGKPYVYVKSIAPFDLDISKQIWKFDDSSFLSQTSIMRPAYDAKNGFLIMGSLTTDKTQIGIKSIDRYNTKNVLRTAKISHSDSDKVKVKESSVIDFVQQKDGSVVMLLEKQFTDENGNEGTVQFLVAYDFEKAELKWSYAFPDQMVFRKECKNKLICTSEGKIAIAGAVIKNDGMHRYFEVIDPEKDGKVYTSPDSSDISNGVETAFTSIWFDGKDYYVCGYDNCDFQYSDRHHNGLIYRFNKDKLSENELVNKTENALFFCIEGIENKWYVCGEYLAAGKILKGCYLSSDMSAKKAEPVTYSVNNKPYCYFSQLCCYENRIVVAGKAAQDFALEKEPLPVIVAFDNKTNEVIWENISFKRYSEVGSIIPNKINTFVVQLLSNYATHYVSADLLGNE